MAKKKKTSVFTHNILLIKLAGKTFYGLLIFFLILISMLILIVNINPSGDFRIYYIISGSMRPTIKTGSLIIIKKLRTYNKNDIVTYIENNTNKKNVSATHRIISVKNKNHYLTKGDANRGEDVSIISKEQIQGKVIFRIPLLGYLIHLSKTLTGLIVFIIIPGLIIVISETFFLIKTVTTFVRSRL